MFFSSPGNRVFGNLTISKNAYKKCKTHNILIDSGKRGFPSAPRLFLAIPILKNATIQQGEVSPSLQTCSTLPNRAGRACIQA
jgi:hypothetical protein